MKKLILHSFICVICIAGITSCSKDVKAPAPVKTDPSNTTSTGTQTQNQDQTGHTCGGHSSDYGGAH